MTATAEQLRANLLALPETDRLELAYFLFDSVEQPLPADETDDDTEEIIARRRAEFLSGSTTLISGEEGLQLAREDLAARCEQAA